MNTDIEHIKTILKDTLLNETINESILWLDDMPIYEYTGIKGLHIAKIDEFNERVSVIEDNAIYDIDKIADSDIISAILEVVKINFNERL